MEKRHFGNTTAPFRLFLGQPLLATNFTDASLLVSLARACLALPLLQSQPHLWLAAPQCTSHLLQMQERDTEDQALCSAHSPQNQNKTPSLSSRAARLSCSHPRVVTSSRTCLHSICSSLSHFLISHKHDSSFVRSQVFRRCRFYTS